MYYWTLRIPTIRYNVLFSISENIPDLFLSISFVWGSLLWKPRSRRSLHERNQKLVEVKEVKRYSMYVQSRKCRRLITSFFKKWINIFITSSSSLYEVLSFRQFTIQLNLVIYINDVDETNIVWLLMILGRRRRACHSSSYFLLCSWGSTWKPWQIVKDT